MIEIDQIKVGDRSLLALKVEMPEAPPLLLIRGERGFVMCGYLNLEVAERLGLAAAVVTGVKSFEDVLNSQIKGATTKASALGLQTGKTVRDVIGLIA
ncbi:DUF1805 domain-containing protein [Candidatus Bathyarchaeota archaeon]|nr:DUF1805 domain-containing protein [Candidatus Bathyarchaeota archaeon]